jgi:hypothetical protein
MQHALHEVRFGANHDSMQQADQSKRPCTFTFYTNHLLPAAQSQYTSHQVSSL